MEFTLHFTDTLEDLDKASAFITSIRHTHTIPVLAMASTVTYRVSSWFHRLGDGSKSFWIRAANHALTHREWTFEDLARVPGEKEELRTYHRNSSRAIKASGAPKPLESRWDYSGGHQVYTMPDAVRDEILALSTGSE